MGKIKYGHDAILALEECCGILDALLQSVNIIMSGDSAYCEIILQPRAQAQFSRVILSITHIIKFDFYYDCESSHYIVTHYKLFITKNMHVYFSLDPFNEEVHESKEDRAVIIGAAIKVEFIA